MDIADASLDRAMASETRFPRFVRGVAALGEPRLRDLAQQANVSVDGDGATQLAGQLLAKLELPVELNRFGVTDGDLEAIGRALGLGTRAQWKPNMSAEEFARLPFYKKPTYEQDVWSALTSEDPMPAKKATRPAKPAKAKAKPSKSKATKSKRAAAAPKRKRR